MSTTNTDHTWYYYIRRVGKKYYIGIVNESGDACDTAGYTLTLYYNQIPDEVDRDSEVPVPRQFESAIISGCVYHILRMYGIEKINYLIDYNNGIRKAKKFINNEVESPITMQTYGIREDDNA